jgi:hypothetical protein
MYVCILSSLFLSFSLYLFVCIIYIYICVIWHLYLYGRRIYKQIYIYIYREREREREKMIEKRENMIYIYIYIERERQQINNYYVRIPAVINILMLFISTCYNLLMWHQKLTKRFHQTRNYRNLLIRFSHTHVSRVYDGSVNRYN